MNALQSYSSDDESEEEPVIKKMNKVGDSGTNYDDVGMDISEDSGDNGESEKEYPKRNKAPPSNNNHTLNARHTPHTSHTSHASHASHASHVTKLDVTSHHERKRVETVKEAERKESADKVKRSNSNEEKAKDDRYSGSRSERSREKGSREKSSSHSTREVKESSRDNKDSSRDYKDSPRDYRESSRDLKESSRRSSPSRRDYRRGSRGVGDRRPIRRSRSRSREKKKSRSRSRSRERERRKRRTRSRSKSKSKSRSRSKSRDRDRRRPHEIRKEAQQKLAAFKASNPNLDHTELLKRGMEAQFAEVQKNTGVTLPSYYNPATMNPLKIAEQERKKKLLWGNKQRPLVSNPTFLTNDLFQNKTVVAPSAEVSKVCAGGSADIWVNTKFSNDNDGRMAEKFKRLMGVRSNAVTQPTEAGASATGVSKDGCDSLQNQETMFNSMEKQYEMARLATHTHKGFGLGFTSQTYLPKP